MGEFKYQNMLIQDQEESAYKKKKKKRSRREWNLRGLLQIIDNKWIWESSPTRSHTNKSQFR